MLSSAHRKLFLKLAIIFLSGTPLPALAEVSDKVPSLMYIGLVGLVAAVVCYLGGFFRRWLVLILAIPPALWFVSLLLEIHAPDIATYLYREQGLAYYAQAYLALAVFVVGVILGAVKKRHAQN